MIDNKTIYYCWLMTTLALCFKWGGKDERLGVMIALTASVATTATALNDDWADIHIGLVIIDLAVLVGFWGICFRSQRFWPLWVTGWQLVSILTHIQRGLFPEILPEPYSLVSRLISYPILTIIGVASILMRNNETVKIKNGDVNV